MPVFRDKDGNIIEEKTQVVKPGAGAPSAPPPPGGPMGDERTRNVSGPMPGVAGAVDGRTQMPGGPMPGAGPAAPMPGAGGPQRPAQGQSQDWIGGATQKLDNSAKSWMDDDEDEEEDDFFEGRTQIFNKKKKKRPAAAGAEAAADHDDEDEESDFMNDPVVGWLAVVKGPGQGTSLPVGVGTNPIGRGSDMRIALEYGDERVSRQNHAVITYDPRGRKFYIQGGGATNLTYIGEDHEVVLAPTELKSGTDITVGDTTLRFIALCGPDFDWSMD